MNNDMTNQNNPELENKNKKTIIICLSTVFVIALLMIGVSAWFGHNESSDKKADNEVNDKKTDDEINESIDDLENITDNSNEDDNSSNDTNKNYSLLGEIKNDRVTYRSYEDSLEQIDCVGQPRYKFNINNGILTIKETKSNNNYVVNSIPNVKSIVGIDYSYSCEQEIYYLLTNDGKIYYTKDTLNQLSDMNNINNYFILLETNYNFTYTNIGKAAYIYDNDEIDGSLGLIAKTTTGEEIVFNDSYEFYKVK